MNDTTLIPSSRQERADVIRAFVAERLFRKPEEVTLASRLIADLGADSLDFVDFQFQLEKRFGVEFREGDFFDSSFRWVTKEGFLKREAVDRFGPLMPALKDAPDPDRVPVGELFNLITVETLLRVVEGKLNPPGGAMTTVALPTRRPSDHVYYSMTKGLCGVCKEAVDAKIIFRDGRAYLDKFCPRHGRQECLIASSAEWYLDCLSFVAPSTPPKRISKPVEKGCPFDCGACASHQQQVYLPVVPITSACNLDCPICYTVNKNDHAHRLSREAMQAILDNLKADHDELDIINFTGGEPTLHPQLIEFLQMCREAGIRRLTISTNGLKLTNEDYVKELAAVDARIVLSLDTFRPEVDHKLLGANTVKTKLRALIDLLEKHDVAVTILPAVAAGLNDDEVGPLLEQVLTRRNMRSLELHTLCFTGQGGVGFERSARITIPDLHRRIEEATQARIVWKDFVPSPLAHPHCYSICYLLLLDGGGYVPFTRLISRAKLFELLEDSLYIEPREKLEDVFKGIIDDLWANPDRLPEGPTVLKTIKRLLKELYPSARAALPILERQRIAERSTRAIYIHSHMDEENFDVSRIMKCCVGVPEVDGSNIPTCSYNVLYREKDRRFADPKMIERMDRTRPLPMVIS